MNVVRGAAWLLLALILTGCLSSQTSEEPERPSPSSSLIEPTPSAATQSSLRWALARPVTLVPTFAVDSSSLTVVDALFDSLTHVDEDGTPVPAAASSWRVNSRSTAWTFTLRPDASFHDGTPVTAEDFRRAWEEGVGNDSLSSHLRDVRGFEDFRAGRAARLDGVRAVGERSLQVLLERPRSDFAVVVAHPALAPVPASAWDDLGAFGRRPIGNGPFAITEDWTGDFIRARAAENWSNGDGTGPHIDEVLFRFTDAASGFVAFQQGRVDIADIPAGALTAARQRYGEADDMGGGVWTDEAAELYMLGMNTTKPPFDDVSVRRALSFAIDRTAIVDLVPDDNARVARSLAPATLPGAASSTCSTCLHAPGAAERVFEDREIRRLELWVNMEGAHREVADTIAEALDAVGVRLVIREVTFDTFVEAVESGEAELFRYGWAAEHPSLEDAIAPLIRTSTGTLQSGNPGRYTNSEVDALVDDALRTSDPAQRRELLHTAERIALGRQQAVIPLMFARERLIVAERVEGFGIGPTGRTDITALRLRRPSGE